MRGKFEEVTGDLGRTADFAVQQDQRARPLRIERAAVQQVSQGADGGESIVQCIENVGGAFVKNDVLEGGRGRGFKRGL
jgi:hypothetical protein